MSASQSANFAGEWAYTMRPRPTQPCAAAHTAQCSYEVNTVAPARSCVDRCVAAHRASDLRVLSPVASGHHPVVVLGKARAVGGDEHRPKRLVLRGQCLFGELNAASEVTELGIRQLGLHHSVGCYRPSPPG
jgi:hypothetical protein